MRKRASGRTLKTFLAIFNVIFWFAGVGFLGLGIWLYLTLQELRAAIEHAQFILPAFLLIISGGAVVIFGVIGCIAIFSENRCLLAFYWLCIIFVLAANIASCVKSFILKEGILSLSREILAMLFTCVYFVKLESHVKYKLNVTSRYKYMYDEDLTDAIDTLQRKYECCGIYNYSEWTGTAYNNKARSLVSKGYQPYPASCCRNANNCSLVLSNAHRDIYKQGCLHPVVDKMKLILLLVCWSTLAISAYLIIESFMVCCFRVTVAR